MNFQGIFTVIALSLALTSTASATLLSKAVSGVNTCLTPDFLTKNDIRFANDCSEFAFVENSNVEGRQLLAWMLFARINQLIEVIDARGNRVKVPKWMAWPTDADTFTRATTRFDFESVTEVSTTTGFVTPKHVLAGAVSTVSPDDSNEQVTRNKASYDYLFYNCLLYTSPSPRDGLLSRMPSSA